MPHVIHSIKLHDVLNPVSRQVWTSDWYSRGARALEGVRKTVYCISFEHTPPDLSTTAREFFYGKPLLGKWFSTPTRFGLEAIKEEVDLGVD
jgi:hypothetical protein